MKWPMEKLGIVAPAKPIKSPKIADSNSVWLLNLDMVESHTGRVIEKLFCSADEAGTSTHWFDENYVLYSKLRPYLNKVVVPDGLGLATTELVPLLPDPERLDKNYLAYYLRSEQFVRWVNEQVAGAKMPRVSMKIFWEHEIPLPPLEEQKRIVTILDKADTIRQKRQQAIALADDFLRSVFLDMFGDPVTNPKGWPQVEISSLCSDIVDCVNRTAPSVDYQTPYKMVRTTNVKNREINLSDVKFADKETYENWIRRLKPKRGDIIFTREAPAGEAGIVNTDDLIFLGQRTMHFRPNLLEAKPSYLLYELTSSGVQQQIVRCSAGSTVTHLSVPECKKFIIRKPSIALQEKFEKHYSMSLNMKANARNALQLSEQVFFSLSQIAFSGQL
ncbi:restriction endonuclease subunit S [Aeromonas veronii]|uniref:restriction endonuclease subunit S n=1 Tax=Aeromonas veronii TaxID=654 RepID=UPI002B47200C|nr:restriction endonuclease subunit S [Aeromonas veronii]